MNLKDNMLNRKHLKVRDYEVDSCACPTMSPITEFILRKLIQLLMID